MDSGGSGISRRALGSASHLVHDRALVERVVRRVVNELGVAGDLDDLRGWGHVGLLEARQRFDGERGVRFSTYAYNRIRGSVIDGVRKQSWLTRRMHERMKLFDDGCALGNLGARYTLDALGDEEERALETPDRVAEANEWRQGAQKNLDALPIKERSVLEAVYFDGATIEQAGRRLGFSKSWASRLHARALLSLARQQQEVT